MAHIICEILEKYKSSRIVTTVFDDLTDNYSFSTVKIL